MTVTEAQARLSYDNPGSDFPSPTQRLRRLCKEIGKIIDPKKDPFHWRHIQWLIENRPDLQKPLGRHGPKNQTSACPTKNDSPNGVFYIVPANWDTMNPQELLDAILAFLRWLKKSKNKNAERLLHAYKVETHIIDRIPYPDVVVTEDNNSQEVVRNTTDRIDRIK